MGTLVKWSWTHSRRFTWLVNKLFARVNPCLVTKIWVVSPSADEILTYIVSIIEEIKPHVTKKQIPQ